MIELQKSRKKRTMSQHAGDYAHKFCERDEKKHWSEELSHISVDNAKICDCLGIILDFAKKHHVGADVTYYQEAVHEEFPGEITPSSESPWNDALLKTDDNSPQLSEEKSETFKMLQ